MFHTKRCFSRLIVYTTLAGALTGCGATLTDPDGNPIDTQLNFVEEEIVAVWSRFHRADGSTKYILLRGDRAWCKWEEANGSNTKLSYSEGTGWNADVAEDANGNHTVNVPRYGLTWKYDYADDELWPDGYRQNLTRHKSSAAKSCN